MSCILPLLLQLEMNLKRIVQGQTSRREPASCQDGEETEEPRAIFGYLSQKAHQGGSNFRRFQYETTEESWKAQERDDDSTLETEETN